MKKELLFVVLASIICTCLTFAACSVKPSVHGVRSRNIHNYCPIAVLEFAAPPMTYSYNISSDKIRMAGKDISDYFEMTLPMSGFRVANRSNLKDVLNEQRLRMSGLTDNDAIKAGRLIGARSVLVGRMTEYRRDFQMFTACEHGYNVAFTAKLLDVETGRILYAGSSEVRGCDSFENTCQFLVATTVQKMAGY